MEISGIEQKELDAYKHLLSLKRATVLELAKVSGGKRANLYRILDSLKKKRLVSEIYEDNKHYFIAESPKSLLEYANKQKEKIQQILPELEKLEKEALERPKVKYFEGKESVRILYNELLAERKEILAFAWPEKLLKAIDFHSYLVEKRLKYKIPCRAIYPDTKAAHKRENTGIKECRFSKNIKPFDATFIISGNKVVMFSLKRWITGVLIENKEIAEGLRALFDGYWNDLKK
jgi:sugar-specific transcriptional regulator TrmB